MDKRYAKFGHGISKYSLYLTLMIILNVHLRAVRPKVFYFFYSWMIDAIQKMTNVYENDETDKILTKWYWQLKMYLRDDPAEKNLACSGNFNLFNFKYVLININLLA